MAESIEKLLGRARAGDDAAFTTVLEELYAPAYQYVYFRLGGHEEVGRVMPEVFERLAELLTETPQSSSTRNHEAYILAIARNVVIDEWRARGRVLSEAGALPEIKESGRGMPKDRHGLALLVAALPGPEQEIIVHKFIRGDSDSETALYMGRTEATVRKTSPQALLRLMELRNRKVSDDPGRITIVRSVLKMLENGTSPKEIRAQLADHEKTVFELFSLFEALHHEGAEVDPPHGLLAEILTNLPHGKAAQPAHAGTPLFPSSAARTHAAAAKPSSSLRSMAWWLGVALAITLFGALLVWFFRPAVFVAGPRDTDTIPEAVDVASTASDAFETTSLRMENEVEEEETPATTTDTTEAEEADLALETSTSTSESGDAADAVAANAEESGEAGEGQ